MKTLASLTAAAALLLLSSHASAALISLDANLDPFQTVPPHNIPGFGFAELTLDTTAATVSITTGNYQDLLGTSTAVTINDAAVGVNGPTILTLTLDNPGSSTGTFSGSGPLTPSQVTDMLAGNTYINLRSNFIPSGEIRGQIELAPEPASLSLLALTAPVVLRRRKSQI